MQSPLVYLNVLMNDPKSRHWTGDGASLGSQWCSQSLHHWPTRSHAGTSSQKRYNRQHHPPSRRRDLQSLPRIHRQPYLARSRLHQRPDRQLRHWGSPGENHARNVFGRVQRQMWDVEFDYYVNTFSVNTAAVWYTIMAFLTLLDKGNEKGNVQQRSQVIATSSIGGFIG